MANFKIEKRQVGEITILDMDGKMRIGESGVAFCDTIHGLVEEGRRKILLNLKGVTHIDSTGLGELIASYNTLEKKGGRVKLLHLSKRIRELMILTKLLTVFDVYESESDALNSFPNNVPAAEGALSSPVSGNSQEGQSRRSVSAEGS
jgi:anti-sigma B factor antagonist